MSRPALRLLTLLVLAASTTGCASLGGRSEADRSFTVEAPVSRSTLVRRTLAAFREQGYVVKESLTSGTEPVSEPFRHGDLEAVFRATITGDARSARVVLRGTYRRRELGGIVKGREQEVVRETEGDEGELWARLVNLGLAIRERRE